jgi:16S rRNA (uracil1498-N3)-methyltransferase
MSERFFAEVLAVGSRVVLAGDEGRHLANVMRARVGDEARLFDGSGAEFAARIAEIRKGVVTLDVIERREIDRELPFSLTLAVALPRGERQKWLVEKATELGVTQLVPLTTERGVALASDSAIERLKRQVMEASKQCGRNRLMEIAQPVDAAALFASVRGEAARVLADPAGRPLCEMAQDAPSSREWLIAVGPEGGFTAAELAGAKDAGWQFISLGPRILRVETAAVALASWVALQSSGPWLV